MITNKLLLLAIVATGFTFGTALQAKAGLRIEFSDRQYYNQGPRYWEGEREMIWVSGHWSDYGHHWIHGHYVRSQRRHDDRRDDRRNDFREDYRR